MSHRPERKEKDCLNCGTMVHGKFCHICGQENAIPKETFGGMVTHFIYDITHFDGKFFSTLRDLFFKPGFLSSEYMKGRRMSYLNPIRMYVFTSAFFFLIFFSFLNTSDVFKIESGTEHFTPHRRDSLIQLLEKALKDDPSSETLNKQIGLLKDTSKAVSPMDLLASSDDFSVVSTIGYHYKTSSEYDSLQKVWPPDKKDNLPERLWNKKAIHLNEKYRHEGLLAIEKLFDSVFHKLPYLLFASLPFFALILKIIYLRRRKEFYYADHAIFTVHHYILSFILLLFIFLWNKLEVLTGWSFWNILLGFNVMTWSAYLYLAMKRFYRQSHTKTFIKFFLLNILAFSTVIVLLVLFFLFSVFQL